MKFYAMVVNDRTVAYHKKEKVIRSYAKMYHKSHSDDNVKILKVKKGKKGLPVHFNDYYLEPTSVGRYVQSRYLDTAEWVYGQYSNYYHMEEQLLSLLEDDDITTKERNAIIEALPLIVEMQNKTMYICTIYELADEELRHEMYYHRLYYD